MSSIQGLLALPLTTALATPLLRFLALPHLPPSKRFVPLQRVAGPKGSIGDLESLVHGFQ